jgi:hypothetical protein
VLFFQVTTPTLIEGVANLNASATARHIGSRNGHDLFIDSSVHCFNESIKQ